MKNRLLPVALITTLMGGSTVYAGSMGPIETQPLFVPFLAGEASYTVPKVSVPSINSLPASKSKQGWGGRLGGGFTYQTSEKYRFISEIGGGYYGSQTRKINGNSFDFSLDGYDVLVGGLYKLDLLQNSYLTGNFDLLVQAGFMIENIRRNLAGNSDNLQIGDFVRYQGRVKTDRTQAFPEIKVGGIYNFNQNWGFSVAYLHVFGSNTHLDTDATFDRVRGLTSQGGSNLQNPTLNAVMFGLRYSIV